MDRGSGSDFTGWFWLRVSRAAVKLSMRLESSPSLTGAGESYSRLLVVVGRRAQVLTTWTSPQDCLSVLRTWQLASSRAKDPRGTESKQAREEPRWQLWSFITSSGKGHAITSAICYRSHGPALVQCGRGLHKGVNPRRRGSLRALVELATTLAHSRERDGS